MTMCETEAPQLSTLPPSAKLVYFVLQERLEEAPLAEIVDESMLQPRTARYALNRLADADLINERPNPSDARQRLYTLKNRE